MSDFMQWALALAEHNSKALGKAVLIGGAAWVIELCIPATTDPGLSGRWHNFKIFVYMLVGIAITAPFMEWCAQLLPDVSLIERVFPNWQKEGISGAILATLIYALVWDFFQYWMHRCEHRLSVLWVFHRVHHSDTDVNSSTALRQSVGSVLIAFAMTHIPATILCGGNMLPYLGATLLFSFWGCFSHCNIRLPLGPLTPILSGPQWHRLHHGKESRYHDKNFAAFFPFLDLLFGTMKMPQKDEWVETGLENDTLPQNTFVQAFLPWRNERPETPHTSNRPQPAVLDPRSD